MRKGARVHMIKITSIGQILKRIHKINTLRIGKPKIIGIQVNPVTWNKIIGDEIYTLENFGIILSNSVPENLAIACFQKLDEEMTYRKIRSIDDLEEHHSDHPDLTIHPTTYKKLHKSKKAILTNLRISTTEHDYERLVRLVPGIILIGYPVFLRYDEGSHLLTDTFIEGRSFIAH